MATTTQTSAPISGSDLVPEKTTVKGFIKEVITKSKGKDGTEITETSYKRQAKAETADGKNWKNMEEEGYAPFNENVFIRYTVKSLSAARLLIPDEAQLVYVIQAGINYVQSTKQNALAIEVKEGTGTSENPLPEAAYNNEEIDLRDALNAPPEKRSLTPYEKLERQIKALGLPTAAIKELLLQAAQQFGTPAASVEEPEAEAEAEAELAQ